MITNSGLERSKIYGSAELQVLVTTLKERGLSIALCHGVFDLLHPGHIHHFKVAKSLADILIVSITADLYVNKGPGRPVFNHDLRAQSLAALQDIDYVTISETPTAIELLEVIKPNFYVKGSDYRNPNDDVTGMIAQEISIVKKNGGHIYFTDEITSSSSLLINEFFSTVSLEAKEWLEEFKASNGYEQALEYLEKIQKLNILLLGETIVDQYTSCTPLAKSGKYPILAFQQHNTNIFLGGILAIAHNCSGWVNSVKVVTFAAPNDETLGPLVSKMNSNISIDLIKTIDRPTILKHRYVESSSNTRVFEYYDFSDFDLPSITRDSILESISQKSHEFDLVLVADYGHGFFDPKIIAYLQSSGFTLSINTQVNAGNRGYNTISKYSRADFITMNGAELQLELRDRNPDYKMILPKLMASLGAKIAIVTLGADGMLVFDNKGGCELVPAFSGKLVDKVGAGDAVFAIASLLADVGAPLKVIGFLSNLVAAHEVSQLGHERSLSQSDIKKHAKSVLR